MHVNKVHSVKTIDRVARELGESVDWLHEVADEMDTEDGVIWVYGDTDDGVMAFTEFGIETLTGLIEMHKEDPTIPPVDPDDAVFGIHLAGDLMQPVHALAELRRGQSFDGMNLVDVHHAAWAG
jgi:hypothetical protein